MEKVCLTNIFLRSLFISSSLNARRMQNMGVAFALIPLVRRRVMKDTSLVSFLQRHLQHFSTNINMAPSILGLVARMEEETRDDDSTAVIRIKGGLAGPYAAMGDAFFWGGLRPLASVVAAGAALLSVLTAPLFFLLIYTPCSLMVRIGGFINGYGDVKRGTEFIKTLKLADRALTLKRINQIILGFTLAWWTQTIADSPVAIIDGWTMDVLIWGVFLACAFALSRSVPPAVILYGAAAFSCLISL